MQLEYIIEQLKNICGLDIFRAELPQEMPGYGILQDVERDETTFSVSGDGKTYALMLKGSGSAHYAAAALAREYVASLAAKSPTNALCEYLNGNGSLPLGVKAGKSDYFVFAVYSPSDDGGVCEYMSTVASVDDFVADMGDGVTAFCKRLDESDDYRSAGEFAVVLKENISEEIKAAVKIGVGGVAYGVNELPKLYICAKTALVGGAEFDPTNDIYSYKEYALIRLLSTLPSADKEQYVKTVLDRSYRDVLSDAELTSAADAFIKHSLNVSEASRNMYVHRNTLIYRLDKIERMTGLNIRNFNDAMTFRIACLVYKMIS